MVACADLASSDMIRRAGTVAGLTVDTMPGGGLRLHALVRDMLKINAAGLTLGQIRLTLLGMDLLVERPEISSCLLRLLARQEVARRLMARAKIGLGRREVWCYQWNWDLTKRGSA